MLTPSEVALPVTTGTSGTEPEYASVHVSLPLALGAGLDVRAQWLVPAATAEVGRT